MKFHSKKTKQIISSIIVAILILSMIIPVFVYMIN